MNAACKAGVHGAVTLFALLALAFAPAQPAAAQDAETEGSRGTNERVQSRDLVLEPAALLWGAGLDLGLRNYLQLSPRVNTKLWLRAGARWGSDSYYRTSFFRIYDGSFGDPEDITSFNEWELRWGVGAAQGLIPMPEVDGRDLLRIEAWYRAFYEAHLLPDEEANDLIAQSGLPDAQALLLNRLFLGLIYDDRRVDSVAKQVDGANVEISLEAAPEALANRRVGHSNFARLNATARYYRTLYDPRIAGSPRPSMGLAAFAAADHLWALGTDHRRIPADTRQAIGGLSPRTGLGGAVRGLDSGRYDANTKVVASVELRSFFPYLIPVDLVPGIVTYIDGGYYRNPAGLEPDDEDYSGFAASTGAGVSINILDLASLVGYTGFNLTGSNVNGRSWKPFFLGFGLHY